MVRRLVLKELLEEKSLVGKRRGLRASVKTERGSQRGAYAVTPQGVVWQVFSVSPNSANADSGEAGGYLQFPPVQQDSIAFSSWSLLVGMSMPGDFFLADVKLEPLVERPGWFAPRIVAPLGSLVELSSAGVDRWREVVGELIGPLELETEARLSMETRVFSFCLIEPPRQSKQKTQVLAIAPGELASKSGWYTVRHPPSHRARISASKSSVDSPQKTRQAQLGCPPVSGDVSSDIGSPGDHRLVGGGTLEFQSSLTRNGAVLNRGERQVLASSAQIVDHDELAVDTLEIPALRERLAERLSFWGSFSRKLKGWDP